jgi:hypothetical protein
MLPSNVDEKVINGGMDNATRPAEEQIPRGPREFASPRGSDDYVKAFLTLLNWLFPVGADGLNGSQTDNNDQSGAGAIAAVISPGLR